MIDLLNTPLPEHELAELLAARPPGSPLPAVGDRAWQEALRRPAPQAWAEALHLLADDECGRPLPELPDESYRQYHATGDRETFEQAYRERRRILARAALCAILFPAERVWCQRVATCMAAIHEEFSWALPAHVNTPSGRDPTHIDADSAETAVTLAEIVAVLGDRLPASLRDAVLARLRSQYFENYLCRHDDFWWTRNAGHNNAVCHWGVLGAALAVEPDARLLARMLARARKYLLLYVRGFGRDGTTGEGPRRWEHGFGSLLNLDAALRRRSKDALALVTPDDRAREIARFGPRLMVAPGRLVNFGDTTPGGFLDPALLFALGRLFGDAEIVAAGRRAWAELAADGIDYDARRGSFTTWARWFLLDPAGAGAAAGAGDTPGPPAGDVFLRDAGILLAHGCDADGRHWTFAAKGGHNAEPHNHNDCGSYLLLVDGLAVADEIGMPLVTRGYLREDRYDYLAARTLGHSLPIVNRAEQVAGPQAAAHVLAATLAEGHAEFSLELTACYPGAAACADLVRTFHFDKHTGRLRVKEFFELITAGAYETAVVTRAAAEAAGAGVRLALGGLRFTLEPFPGTAVVRLEDQPYHDLEGRPQLVRRIVLGPEKNATRSSVGYELRLGD